MIMKGMKFLSSTEEDFNCTLYCSGCGLMLPDGALSARPPSKCPACCADTIMIHYPVGTLILLNEMAE